MPASRVYTQRHFKAAATILAAERAANGPSPVLNRLVAAFTAEFTQDSQADAGAGSKRVFDPVLFRQAALGQVPVSTRPQRGQPAASGKQAQ